MRKKNILLLLSMVSLSLFAQEKIYIHKSDKIILGALISKTDSIYFNSDGSVVYFSIGDTVAQYSKSAIDSILFGNNDTTIYINYNGTVASVINPLAFEGVNVVVDGANVTVNATGEIRDINYNLSGTTTGGMFKIYSEKRFNLLMNGVNITNSNGPAINIQSSNKVFVNLADGTTNTLTDGIVYASPTIKSNGNAEDQDAAFFSEGKLEFSGTGNLTINGRGLNKHALSTDDLIEIDGGSIIIASTLKDGIHANDGIKIHGGSVNVKSQGEAIDGGEGYINISGGIITTATTVADTKGIKCDSTLTITGGIINLTVGGIMSKGIKAKQNMILSGGDITIAASGGVALATLGSGYKPSYCSAISCDSSITISGATINIISTGISGKGISSNSDINITSGSVTVSTSGAGATYTNYLGVKDSYSSSCIGTDGNLNILGGTVIATSSGIGGKGLSVDGTLVIGDTNNSPIIKITTTGAKFLVSGTDYCHPKALRSTGTLTVNNGTITIASSDDAIHSETSIIQNNGSITISNSIEGVESKFITINGGSISIAASDDGFNATFSTVSGGTESNDGSCLYINGGNIVSSTTKGDAIDSNGNIIMSGGTLIVHGPPSQPEEAVDFNGTFKITGGFLIAAGTNSNMNKPMSTSTTQNGIYALTTSAIAANTIFHIQDANGIDLVTFKPARASFSFLYSSANMINGTYYIYTGGTSTGTATNGLYTGGVYSGGTLKKTFIISTKVTSLTF